MCGYINAFAWVYSPLITPSLSIGSTLYHLGKQRNTGLFLAVNLNAGTSYQSKKDYLVKSS